MNRQEFIDTLRQKLTEEGFPATYVEKQCAILTDNLNALPEDQAAQYINPRNVDILVRKFIAHDGNLIQSATEQTAPEAAPQAEATAPAETDAVTEAPAAAESADESAASEAVTEDAPAEPAPEAAPAEDTPPPAPITAPRSSKRRVPVAEYTPCDKPLLLTFLLTLICAPTLILFLTTAFGLFAGIFLALAASIFVIVIAIIGIVALGSVVSLASLLYGATQILSSPRYVGFHEIGFGLIVAGVTMGSSILLYNLAIRWIPFISQQMGKLFKLFFQKIVSFAKNAVKGCEQL